MYEVRGFHTRRGEGACGPGVTHTQARPDVIPSQATPAPGPHLVHTGPTPGSHPAHAPGCHGCPERQPW
eukprot:144254-Chlamydomonas_euryale.AAC.9